MRRGRGEGACVVEKILCVMCVTLYGRANKKQTDVYINMCRCVRANILLHIVE